MMSFYQTPGAFGLGHPAGPVPNKGVKSFHAVLGKDCTPSGLNTGPHGMIWQARRWGKVIKGQREQINELKAWIADMNSVIRKEKAAVKELDRHLGRVCRGMRGAAKKAAGQEAGERI